MSSGLIFTLGAQPDLCDIMHADALGCSGYACEVILQKTHNWLRNTLMKIKGKNQ